MAIQAIVDPIMATLATVGTDVAATATAVGTALTTAGPVAALGELGAGVASTAADVGIPAGVASGIGSAAEGAIAEGTLGAVESAATGKNVGKGFLEGAITGGVTGGFGPAIGAATGLGTAAGEGIAGAAGGALGGLATGGNVAGGAIQGGVAGLGAGMMGGGTGAGIQGGAPVGGGIAGIAPGAGGIQLQPGVDVNPTFALSGPDVVPGTDAAATVPASADATSAPNVGQYGSDLSTAPTPSGANLNAPTTSTLPGGAGANAPTAGAGSPPGGATASGLTVPTQEGKEGFQWNMEPTVPTIGSQASNIGTPTSISGPVGQLAPSNVNPNPNWNLATRVGNWMDQPGNVKTALTAGAFGMDLLKGNQPLPYQGQVLGAAQRDALQGQQMESYLNSGLLPPGMQKSLDIASEAAKASIRSQYASRGMSGSSAQQQDIAAVGERQAAEAGQMAQQLFQMGMNESSQADQLYMYMMGEQMKRDQALSDAVGKLASSFAQSGQPVVPNATVTQTATA